MEIRQSELRNGIEVDCGQLRGKIMTIKYDNTSRRYVLSEVETGEIHYSYNKLSDLLRNTNVFFKLNDKAIDDWGIKDGNKQIWIEI